MQTKQSLKGNGVKVAAHLTKRQRAEIDRVRKDGKFGYYKNGRLHIEDRHSPGDRPTDHDQGPLQDKRRQRSNTLAHRNEDRQQQQASGGYDNDDVSDDIWHLPTSAFETTPSLSRETLPAMGESPRSARGARTEGNTGVNPRSGRPGGDRRNRDMSHDSSQPLMSDVLQRTPFQTRSGRGRAKEVGSS
ncbi:hypothetical protein BaRGS_00013544 [Batillaria attramentaria]|uniref:Uncharacterized protein n=1 Tax=Batillaria attramentaria TaxID=370345 RepID=A0ABD0L698_9CAEN